VDSDWKLSRRSRRRKSLFARTPRRALEAILGLQGQRVFVAQTDRRINDQRVKQTGGSEEDCIPITPKARPTTRHSPDWLVPQIPQLVSVEAFVLQPHASHVHRASSASMVVVVAQGPSQCRNTRTIVLWKVMSFRSQQMEWGGKALFVFFPPCTHLARTTPNPAMRMLECEGLWDRK
jgi:hypothetical protein